jgi:uncharacterized protein
MQEIYAGGPNGAQIGNSRVQFIRSTYTYLAGAMLAFVALSGALNVMGVGEAMLKMLSGGSVMWLAFMGVFMLVGWGATHIATTAQSNEKQIMGLGIYVVAEALIFAPILVLASKLAPGSIGAAAFITIALVSALTWTAFTSKTDFSFLGSFLKVGGIVALVTIVAAVIFKFQLGIWFSGLMVLFAGAAVLYDTSKIIRDYPADRPAGAALHLFASIAMMFWYVLRILMSLSSND